MSAKSPRIIAKIPSDRRSGGVPANGEILLSPGF